MMFLVKLYDGLRDGNLGGCGNDNLNVISWSGPVSPDPAQGTTVPK